MFDELLSIAHSTDIIKRVVFEAKATDRLFLKTGVEEEQLWYTLGVEGLDEDPEIQRISQEYAKKI